LGWVHFSFGLWQRVWETKGRGGFFTRRYYFGIGGALKQVWIFFRKKFGLLLAWFPGKHRGEELRRVSLFLRHILLGGLHTGGVLGFTF